STLPRGAGEPPGERVDQNEGSRNAPLGEAGVQPPAVHASQQLAKLPTHADPPGGGTHLLASDLIEPGQRHYLSLAGCAIKGAACRIGSARTVESVIGPALPAAESANASFHRAKMRLGNLLGRARGGGCGGSMSVPRSGSSPSWSGSSWSRWRLSWRT